MDVPTQSRAAPGVTQRYNYLWKGLRSVCVVNRGASCLGTRCG